MKKILNSLIILLALTIFRLLPSDQLRAQVLSITHEESPIESSLAAAFVEYNLAFPGILPDHPLYKLKVVRDKLVAWFTGDPLKKVNFYLLQTDKGILATAMLVDKGKFDLARQTALKAEHNYTLITYELYNLPEKPSDDFFQKLTTAALKHQEVLNSLISRVPASEQDNFRQVIDFSRRNVESVNKYKQQITYEPPPEE